MIYILDTDHLSLIQDRNGRGHRTLMQRISAVAPEDICTTVVSFHEQMKGWLAFLARAKSSAQTIIAYGELFELLDSFCDMSILPYDDHAEDCFVTLRNQHVRIGTMDLRIAAIALARGGVVVSRNLRDFQKVPGLIGEDWTTELP